MWKKALALFLYVVMLVVTISSAWILHPNYNKGPFAELVYSGQDGGGRLSVASQAVEMQVDFEMNGKMKYLGSSKDKISAARPKLPAIIPNMVIPFRIRFYNTSDQTVSMSLMISGITCHKEIADSQSVYVAAVGGAEYSKYAETVNVPGYIYVPMTSGTLVSVDEENASGTMVTYDLLLYDDLQIPPTPNRTYVVVEGYFFFDPDHMENDCEGKTFNIQSFRAVQK